LTERHDRLLVPDDLRRASGLSEGADEALDSPRVRTEPRHEVPAYGAHVQRKTNRCIGHDYWGISNASDSGSSGDPTSMRVRSHGLNVRHPRRTSVRVVENPMAYTYDVGETTTRRQAEIVIPLGAEKISWSSVSVRSVRSSRASSRIWSASWRR